MIMFYISFGCSYINSTASFRIPWDLEMIPAMTLFVGCMFIPRSPRWLARKGRWKKAEEVLALLHGGGGDRMHPHVEQEMADIQSMVKTEKQNADVTVWEIFRVFTQIWSQLTGMNVMMYYITYIFKISGLTSSTILISSIQYVINVSMTIPALLFIDKVGRRPVFLLGSTLMASYGHPGIGGTPAASWVVHGPASKALIACSYLFVACTWGPASWVYPPELFPQRTCSKAVAIAACCNWIFNFELGYFVPPAFENIQWRVYVIFCAFCAAMTMHVFFMFPEAAGKSLEEVEDMFLEGTPAWRTGGEVMPYRRGDAPVLRGGMSMMRWRVRRRFRVGWLEYI